jgi:proteasome accessory factor C
MAKKNGQPAEAPMSDTSAEDVDLFSDKAFQAAPDVDESSIRRSRRPVNPAKEAADRVRLLLSIPPYLISKGEVPLSRLARDFNISVSTADALIRTLAVSGLPGSDGSYMPYDLFDIDWDLFLKERVVFVTNEVELRRAPRLTSREAATLVAGLQYIENIPGITDRRAIKALREKLAKGANVSSANAIHIEPPPTPPLIEEVRKALDTKTQLEIVYQNADQKRKTRSIEPLRIDLVASSWYVRGYCHTREGIMTFRIDRIIAATNTRRKHTTRVLAEELGDELFDPPTSGLHTVVLEMPSNSVRLITEFAPQQLAGAPAGFARVSVTIGSLRSLARVVASLPGTIRIVSPPEATRTVTAWAKEALSAYPASRKPSK